MARKTAAATTAPPTSDDVLAYLRQRGEATSISEMARDLALKGKDRTALRLLLKDLVAEGLVESAGRRKFSLRGTLPKVTVLEITGLDSDGELRARPARWTEGAPPPDIFVAQGRGGARALAVGERILARLTPSRDGFDAMPIRRLGAAPLEIIGVYERVAGQGRIRPTDRRAKYDYGVSARHAHGAEPGDVVRARPLPERRRGMREAEITERIGHIDSPGAIGIIALHSNGVPIDFSDGAWAEAEAAAPPTAEGREDLRGVPLVTIDDEDARDFDDAVFAEPDPDRANKGGHRLIVAIADVAWFVRPDGALDTDARLRGNSVYLPDRVVPMLPEALSAGLCSLKPHEDRAVVACHMRIDANGELLSHRFSRAFMRSAARLTYRRTQRAHDGESDALPDGLAASVVENLYGAFAALERARRERGTLELDLPEYKVTLDDEGKVSEVGVRTRLASHRLIEEFMITANVAAAEALEERRMPAMYRVHQPPDAAKLEALREFLESFGLNLPRGQVLRPRQFNDILSRAAADPSAAIINEAILRSQSQAAYGPRNYGHFGLALRRYVHFTSPIRRYADLLVHRALISGHRLGPGGLPRDAGARFEELGDHLSATERRAQTAEREAVDRYMALYLSDRVGARMKGRITGVTRFGLFVRLDGVGADGLVPASLLGDERFDHDERDHTLTGYASGRVFALGDEVVVRLREASPVTGGLIFDIINHRAIRKPRPSRRRRRTRR